MLRASPALLSLAVLGLAGCAPEGPSGFVTFNVVPDQRCVYSPDVGGNLFYPMGRYDISPGRPESSIDNACARPYVVHLLVNSYLRENADTMLGRAEPNVLQLHSAEVTLMDLQHRTIEFGTGDNQLPNPFLVTTSNSLFPASGSSPSTGIAAVEVVPLDYAAWLDSDRFIDAQVLAEIKIFGTTTGDVDVDIKPFVYSIEICYGCMTVCQSVLAEIDDENLFGTSQCRDNAGADGRICLDPGC